MQILKNLYQVGGDLNGVTFDLYRFFKTFCKSGNGYDVARHGLIYFYKPQYRIEESLNSALIEWR